MSVHLRLSLLVISTQSTLMLAQSAAHVLMFVQTRLSALANRQPREKRIRMVIANAVTIFLLSFEVVCHL